MFTGKAATPTNRITTNPFSRTAMSSILIANSIGAFFSMNALGDKRIKQAFFISPMVNLEKLICDMMACAGVSEADLREKKTIATSFGETLSWEYLCYVRENPIQWNIFTFLY